jgi:hypothetical protein
VPWQPLNLLPRRFVCAPSSSPSRSGASFNAMATAAASIRYQSQAVHTEHISIAHAGPRLNVEASHESAADKSNSELLRWHQFRGLLLNFTYTASVFDMPYDL